MYTISFIIGGLGNQMFQYAMGRAVAHRNNVPLILDMRGYIELNGGCTKRELLLDKFNIMARFADPQIVREFLSYSGIPVVHEPHFNFWPDGMKLGLCYLDGYWQTEKYFADIRNLLLEDFTLRNPSETYTQFSTAFRNGESIALHVRRGDYASAPALTAKHGLMGLEYYSKAMELMPENLIVHVYSDGADWCVNELIPGLENKFGKRFTMAPELVDYEYMMLMSNHRHFIIANSSFSWWSAWLCRDPGIVVCPARWMADKSMNTVDVCPDRWVRV